MSAESDATYVVWRDLPTAPWRVKTYVDGEGNPRPATADEVSQADEHVTDVDGLFDVLGPGDGTRASAPAGAVRDALGWAV